MKTKITAVKPLTRTEMRNAIKMLERACAEHERLWYAYPDARYRMETHAAHEALMLRYELAIHTLRYAVERRVSKSLQQMFEFPVEAQKNG